MKRLAGGLAALVLAWSLAATGALAEGRWQQVENMANCVVWNAVPFPAPKETVTWTGKCENGRIDGKGKLIWRYLISGSWNEVSYTGAVWRGRKHGRGVFVFANGNRYEGNWRGDRPNGNGTYYYAEDAHVLSGYWKNGCLKRGRRLMMLGATKEECGF